MRTGTCASEVAMRTLVVAPQPFFSFRGTPFSVYYRTLVAGELGAESDLLTYGQGTDVDLPGCRIYRIPTLRWLGQVKTGPSLLKLVLDAWMVLWTVALLLRRRYDVLHAHEEAVFWCMWLKPLFRFRLIYDMHSSLPQQLNNFGYTRSRIVHWTFQRLERRAVRSADAVITICPALSDYAMTLTEQRDKIYLIENSIFEPVKLKAAPSRGGTETDPVAAVRDSSLRKWLAARPQGQTLVYAGTLERYQGIDRLLQAFALVVERLPRAGLLIVGGLPGQREHYELVARQLGITGNVYFAGQVPQSVAQRLVRMAAASISPRAAGDNTPLKIYELMANTVPLVATRIDSHTQILHDDICTLTGIEPEEMADGIVWVLTNPEGAREKAALAERWYREHYSREVYTSKMRTLMERVAS
jgi:glycosyltransferase involved in cell wall biosynthesis